MKYFEDEWARTLADTNFYYLLINLKFESNY